MLVISRRLNEKFTIGKDITVMITQIDTERKLVRLGIEAPPNVMIDRDDVIRGPKKRLNGG